MTVFKHYFILETPPISIMHKFKHVHAVFQKKTYQEEEKSKHDHHF